MKIFKCLCFLVAFLHTFHQVPSQNLPSTLGAECDNCSFGADKSPESLYFHGYPGVSLIFVISVDMIYFCLLIGKGFVNTVTSCPVLKAHRDQCLISRILVAQLCGTF